MDKVRVLVIGVGSMGQFHIKQLLQVPDAEILGMVDPSPLAISATRARFAQLADTPAFADWNEALRISAADAAVIVTPHTQHFEQGMGCLEAGMHVLMEKPFVAGSANAARLVAVAQERGKHLAVAYQRHLEGTYMYLRELIQTGALGTIQYVAAYQAQAWRTATMGTWRQDPALSGGGQLNDSGSHLLDVVLWSTDVTPVEVQAWIDNRGTPVDIDTALQVRCAGGALLSFTIVGSASIAWHEDVSIHGSTGTALYRNGMLAVARAGEPVATPVPPVQLPRGGSVDSNFVDLILGRVTEAAAPAACGLRVASVTEAAWESARLGRAVRIAAAPEVLPISAGSP